MASAPNPQHPAPILFAFGGWGDSPENFRKYSRFTSGAVAKEAIVVYPRANDNAWEGAPYSKTPRGEDVNFVRQIVDELKAHFAVDTNRIYAVGMSNGGGFTANLACQAPDLVAGIVGISGAYYAPVNEHCARGQVPTFLIHGDQDKLTHYEGGLLHDAPYVPVQDLLRSRAHANGCQPQPVVVELPNNVTQFGYPGCVDEAVHWRLKGQGHNWHFSPDVAAEAWRFLARQNRTLPHAAQ